MKKYFLFLVVCCSVYPRTDDNTPTVARGYKPGDEIQDVAQDCVVPDENTPFNHAKLVAACVGGQWYAGRIWSVEQEGEYQVLFRDTRPSDGGVENHNGEGTLRKEAPISKLILKERIFCLKGQ